MSPIQPPSKPPKAVAKRKPDMSALATRLEKPSSWKYSVKKTRAWNGMEPATPCKASMPDSEGLLGLAGSVLHPAMFVLKKRGTRKKRVCC